VKVPRPGYLAALVCLATVSRAASFDERIESLFRPVLGEHVALSPDGQRVAYTTHLGAELALVIRNVENPGP
jgi:hypothetical protein